MKKLPSLKMPKRYLAGFMAVSLLALLSTALVSCDTSSVEVVIPDPDPDPDPLPPGNFRPYMKRGVAYNFLFPRSNPVPRADMELLSPGVRWFYNWAMSVPAQVETLAAEHDLVFIPQRWSASGWGAGGFDSVLNNLRGFVERNPETRWIMAYNEPMLTNEANLTPAQAAADWPNILRIADELDLKVLSPALTFGNIGTREGNTAWNSPDGWFDAFLEQPGVYLEDIDIVRIHTYIAWMSAVSGYINRFRKYDRPIWVTEFAAWGNPVVPTDEEWQMRFMSEAVMYFELEPLIEKYFWFIPKGGGDYYPPDNLRPPFNKLLTQASPTQLTRLGVVYVNMPHVNINRKTWVPLGRRMTAAHITNATTVAAPTNRMVHFRPSTDTAYDSEILDIHRFATESWIEFQARVPASGSRTLSLRNMAPESTVLDIHANGVLVATANLAQSGEWRTTEVPLELAEGDYTIRLSVRSGNCAINWLRLD